MFNRENPHFVRNIVLAVLAALVAFSLCGLAFSAPYLQAKRQAYETSQTGWTLDADTGTTDNDVWNKPYDAGQMTDANNKVWYTQSSVTAGQTAHFSLDSDHAAIIDSYTVKQGNTELTNGYLGVVVGPVSDSTLEIFNGAVQIVAVSEIQDKLSGEYFDKFCKGSIDSDFQPWALSHLDLAGYSFPAYPESCSTTTSNTSTTSSGDPIYTGVGATKAFEAHTPVLGYKIVLSDGSTFSGCYLADPALPGKVTDGAMFPTSGDIASLPACK